MMAEPDPARTLALASQFRAPPPSNKALQDLQTRHLLTEMEQTGAAERSTASDLSRLRGVLAPQGLMPSTLTPEYLDPIRGGIAAKRGGEAISSAAAGGVRFPRGTPAFALPETYQQKAVSGFPLKGEAAELAKAKVKSMEGSEETIEYPEFDEKLKRVVMRKKKITASREGGIKGSGAGVTKNAQAIQASVAAKLKAMGRAFKSIEVVREGTDDVVVRIDGKEVTIPYND